MKHIKKFNEAYMRGGETVVGGHQHLQTVDDKSQIKPNETHTAFLIRFVDDLVDIKNQLEREGHVDKHDMNYIEELYSLHNGHLNDN